MAAKTYGFVRDFVQKKLDLQEETFITPAELLESCEEAIKFCESEVHKLGIEDQYFETCAPIVVTANRYSFDLPPNIFANKITRLVYNNGSEIYDIERLRGQYRHTDVALINQYNQGARYMYRLLNHDVRSGTKVTFSPASRDTTPQTTFTADLTAGSNVLSSVSSVDGLAVGDFVTGTGIANGAQIESIGTTTITLSSNVITTGVSISVLATRGTVTCWFLRDAAVPTTSDDLIDFPEFWTYIAQNMIVTCLAKELGNPRIAEEKEKLGLLQAQVVATLTNMVPDQDDKIEIDTSNYDAQYTGDGIY